MEDVHESPSQRIAGAIRREPAHRIAAAALIAGTLCPWATFLGLASVNGLQAGTGWVTLVCGIAMFLLATGGGDERSASATRDERSASATRDGRSAAATRDGRARRARRALGRVLGLVCLLACGLTFVGIGRTPYGPVFSPAWGLYLSTAAAAAAAWGPLPRAWSRRHRGASTRR